VRSGATETSALVCFELSPETYRAARGLADLPILEDAARDLSRGDRPTMLAKSCCSYKFRHYPMNSTFDLAAKRREFEIFFETAGARTPSRARRPHWRAIRQVMSSPPKAGRMVGVAADHGARGESPPQTLSDMIVRERIERIDLLKIDVEGPELDVLRGIGAGVWPFIKQVVLETHDRDGRLARIEEILRSNGLTDLRVVRQATMDNGLESILLLAAQSRA
jgi:FkbM family methyltransferase